MRSRLARFGLLVITLALLGGATPAAAQEAASPGQLDITPVDVATQPEVSTLLTAPTQLGQEELRPGSVTVTEGGEAVATKLVRLESDQLEVVLALDTSGSIKGESFTSAKLAAGAFIARLPVDAKVALVAFGDKATLASPLTADRNKLLAAVQGLSAGGRTSLFDALRLASRQFSDDAEGSRRSIIVLSDGGDTASQRDLLAATDSITAARARVDVVELGDDRSAHDPLVLLATVGGGRLASVSDPTALAGIYDSLAASLGNEYRLTWTSSAEGRTKVVVKLSQEGVKAQRVMTLDYPRPPVGAAASAHSVASAPTWALVLGATCIAGALFIMGLFVFAPRQRRRRLARLGATNVARGPVLESAALTGLVERATGAAEAALERRGDRQRLNQRLEQAGIDLRPGEFIVLAGAGITVGLVVGLLIGGLLLALVLAAVAAGVAYAALSMLRTRRQDAFSEQLGDSLQHLAGALRAGHGLLQAVEALGREAAEPTSGEFRRVVVETRLGRDFSDSLHAMGDRIGTEDVGWVIQAFDIHRDVGGDLAQVLDTIAGTIRERNQVFRQVKSLTAEGRLSAYILLALPPLMALALRVINPDYFHLLTYGTGLVISMVAMLMMAGGAVWFNKLCKLEY